MAIEKSIIPASVIVNLETVEIRITEDKLRVVLNNHFEKIKKRRDFASAIALFLTLLGTVLFSDFHDITINNGSHVLVPVGTLSAVYFILLLASVFYVVYALVCLIKYRVTVDDIIKDIKGEK